MELLIERLSPPQIVAVISVVCGCTVAITMIVAITKYQFQLLADETALKREKQQAELAMRQKAFERGSASGASLDALLTPEGSSFDEEREHLNAELAKRFGSLDLRADDIESALSRALGADATRKASILGVMDELLENEAAPAAILAAVRPLCGPAREPLTAGA